ncbi:kinetochore complex Fta4 of Sim4 subunit, or CENP-50-domain-containing protein [Aspergillus cavernicola]|uniref:Kinetochore complex Fta4 of Sim4 subunit, or CENP-50-domain-containing protein n=1 Tax=Aspergillus cavernicola TaxID=176166 RepID=A0ABR4IAZ7_9EURO
MDSSRSIPELKTSFIRAQVRILSESLEASEDWRSYAAEPAEEDLSDKVVGDVLQKLNAALKQHSRIIYSSQAIQHVAQQIATLYWSSVSQATREVASLEGGVDKTVDLSSHPNITQLPGGLYDQSASDEDQLRYKRLRERLATLDNLRQQRQRRLDQLRQLQRLLEPFREPQENVQPNLVTRDGELARELEKMRMLVARASGRIGQRQMENNDGGNPLLFPLFPPESEPPPTSPPLSVQQNIAKPAKCSFRASLPISRSLPHIPTFLEGEYSLPSDTIAASTPPCASNAPFVRGHRRRSTHVSRRDLEKFRKDVLGVESTGFEFDDEPALTPNTKAFDSQLEELNRAFDAATMSLNNSGSNSGSAMFSNYTDSPAAGPSNLPGVPRQPIASPIPPPPQVNGAGMAGINGGVPMNAGHQMDLRHLFDMVLELSEVLKTNRETTKSIVSSAEEIMKRTPSEGTSPSIQQVNGEISSARIAELERALAKEKQLVEILRHEQAENTKLIGEYEAAVGTMVEQIRNYCHNNNMHYLSQKRHYNNLLQAERDSHLESRLDRDHWHAQTMKCAEMIRTAYHLRCEEEELPVRIVAGLQNEVRAYRNALGMEPEKAEEEYGWEILQHVPGGSE